MTTLAGAKIKLHRLSQTPRLSREAFGALFGNIPGPTIQGWEMEGKRPVKSDVVAALAREGIADAGDWFVPARCPRCDRPTDDQAGATCAQRECPLALKRSVAA